MTKISIEKLFLIISLFFGMLYVFILPPFQSVDEGAHFFRTYQISQGRLVSQNIDGKIGDYLPAGILKYYEFYYPMIKNIDVKTNINNIKRDLSIKINNSDTQYIQFGNTSLYSPLCYISELPGVILGKFLNFPPCIIFYLGRICNLFVYCLLVYYAIKNIPFFKFPLFLLAIMPMSLSLGASYTSDVMVFGLNFLWVAYILKILVSKEKIRKTDILIFVFMALLISLLKSYILLLPLIFLIPKEKFNNKIEYLSFVLCIFILGISGNLYWLWQVKDFELTMNPVGADSHLQLEYIKSNVFLYIWIMIKTFVIKTPRFIITMVGVLGWQDTRLDFMTYIIYPILIYFAICSEKFDFVFKNWQKFIIFITVTIGTIIAYTSLYLMWTPVGNDIILGLNGKYFIPMILPFLMLFKNNKYDLSKFIKFIIFVLLLILISSELSLIHRFYDLTPSLYYKV